VKTASRRLEYLRNWRLAHPTYNRDWMRRYRADDDVRGAERVRERVLQPLRRQKRRRA
jgi:hypothetical protein